MPLIAAFLVAAFGILLGIIPALWWSAVAYVVLTILHFAIPSTTAVAFSTLFHFLWTIFGAIGGIVGFFVGLLGGVSVS